jgi:hypothetical protein
MESFLINLAFAAPFVMLAVSGVTYMTYRHTNDGRRRSFFLFLLGVLFSGFLAALVVVNIFARVACSGTKEDWCGWGAVMVSEPIAVILGVTSYLYYWAKRRN